MMPLSSKLRAVLLLAAMTPLVISCADHHATDPSAGQAPEAAEVLAAPAAELSLLVANVGNISPWCGTRAFKLCQQAVEDRLAANIQNLRPDVAVLIEVLTPQQCDGTAALPYEVCFTGHAESQVRRLLGPDYTITCADGVPWDCIAVRESVAHLAGCEGGDCGSVLPVVPVPEGCDAGFQVFGADLTLHGGRPLHLLAAHPDSQDAECRAVTLTHAFDALPLGVEVIVAGDLNLDPYRQDDASTAVWHQHVGANRRFAYLSGIAEHDPPYFTLVPMHSSALDPSGALPVAVELADDRLLSQTLDHVVATRGIGGRCVTLGEASGSQRLDGGGGTDHRALWCSVQFANLPMSQQRNTATP